MNQVAVSLIAMALPELERRGVPIEETIADLPVTLDELRKPSHRIDWDVMVEVLERTAAVLGGYDALEEFAANLYALPWTGLRKLGALGGSPAWLYGVLSRWWASAFFPSVEFELGDLPDGRGYVRVGIPDEDRVSPAVWCALRGLIRGMPRALGLPDAVVEAEIDGHTAVFKIVRPPRHPLWPRIRNRVLRMLSSRALLDQFVMQQDELAHSYELLREQSQRLAESEARHRALIAHTQDLIVVCDEHARVHFASPSVFHRLGVAEQAVLEHDLFGLVHPDDLECAQSVFERALRTGSGERGDFRVWAPDGEPMWLEASGQRFPAADGSTRVLIAARDVGERKRAELELQRNAQRLESQVERQIHALRRANVELQQLHGRLIEAERMCAAQELAGRVSHAINNPLAALIGHIQLMLDDEDDADPKLERVLELARRIGSVVTRTLELSREGRLNFTLESPAAILRDVHDEIVERCARRGVQLELKIEDGMPKTRVDPTLLRAALVSIAENAIDAAPESGTVQLYANATSRRHVIEFRIEDNGPGVPEELREKILEPFFTTKAEGTGLGLAIARGVIGGHGGRISLSGRPGGGTIATIEIPTYLSPISDGADYREVAGDRRREPVDESGRSR